MEENIIQFSGRATLEEELDLGRDYDIMVTANVHKVEHNDNNQVVFKVKPVGYIAVMKDKGIVPAKTKGSLSQQWRWFIEGRDDYDCVMIKMLNNREKVFEFISKLD